MLQRHAIVFFIALSLCAHVLVAWLVAADHTNRQVISAQSISLTLSQQSPEPPAKKQASEKVETENSAPAQVIKQHKPAPTKQVAAPQARQQPSPSPAPKNEKKEATPTAQPKSTVQASANSIAREKVTQHVQLALVKELRYPMIARRRGWEGIVVIAVHLDSQGKLSNFSLIKTSGYPLLDESASRSLQRLASVPEVINWLNGRELNIELPVEYRLVDS